ncbi:MAG: DUF6089 family protein [Saprospiraceae bacterium]|nr:OmpA family protein [Lewinella sp.]
MDRLFFSLLVSALCFSLQTTAQTSPWRLDFFFGPSAYMGDLADQPFYSRNWHPVGGIGIQYQLGKVLALKSSLYHGQISGNDAYFETEDWPRGDRLAHFSSPITNWSTTLEYHPLDKLAGDGRKLISPYIAFGGGLLIYDPDTYFDFTRNPELEEAIAKDNSAKYAKSAASLDLGVGVDWRVMDRWTIGLTGAVHPTGTDFLDGVSFAGNPNKRDWFTRAGLRIQYDFVPESDTDRDGIPNSKDMCPNSPGLPETQGCPDSDRDGIHDGIDMCASIPGKISLNGCPDTDGDGIADKDDLCPDRYGSFQRGGCPIEDRDQDGIEDYRDRCPDQAGPPEREGCPVVDRDQDGILDEDDHCPDDFGLSIFGGCPDTDGDGIEDSRDACPTLFGVYTHNGCPEVVFPEDAAAEFNRQYLLFELGSDDIARYELLDQIVEFMEENREYKLDVNGFTDNEGNAQTSLSLSRARARRCYRYLVEQGIDENRISFQGLGAKPLSSGVMLPRGQARNRRVEFFLYK